VKKPRSKSRARQTRAKTGGRRTRTRSRRGSRLAGAIEIQQIEALQRELARAATRAHPPRWNADPADVRRSVIKLVLTLVEFIRRVLERQAIRRVEAGTLTAEEIEAVGTALMRLEETVRDLGAQFDLGPEDLNLDLGPVGKLI
jgi:hypothetical protein